MTGVSLLKIHDRLRNFNHDINESDTTVKQWHALLILVKDSRQLRHAATRKEDAKIKFPGSFYFHFKSRVASLNIDVTGKYGVLANRVRIVESPPRVWAAALVKRWKVCQWNLKSASHLAFFLAVQDNSITDIVCRSLGPLEPTNNQSLGSIKEWP